MDYNERQIREAIATLALGGSQARILEAREAERVAQQAEAAFVSRPGLRWWWESLRLPATVFEYPGGDGYLHLLEHLPADVARCWWIVESDDDGPWIVLSVAPEVVPDLIGACVPFEYYLVGTTLDWLVCENHHDQVVVAWATPEAAQLPPDAPTADRAS